MQLGATMAGVTALLKRARLSWLQGVWDQYAGVEHGEFAGRCPFRWEHPPEEILGSVEFAHVVSVAGRYRYVSTRMASEILHVLNETTNGRGELRAAHASIGDNLY